MHLCLLTRTSMKTARTTALHKGHHNLTHKKIILLQGHLPSNSLYNLGQMPPFLFIFIPENCYIKTTCVIVLILPLKTSSWPTSLNIHTLYYFTPIPIAMLFLKILNTLNSLSLENLFL